MQDSKEYIGTVLDRRYRIERTIGIGGMAFVYEATDIVHNRQVAIKLLKPKYYNDPRAMTRFTNEAKVGKNFDNPYIVRIHGVNNTGELKYIVMEYIPGMTLRKYLTSRLEHKNPIDWREAVEIVDKILLALEYAHSYGVVHRDIKPQNIMVLPGGKIKVTDFGIAKIPQAETLTLADKAIGTVYYISPEQARGGTIDARTDIYSLGVMLYEMVTGKLPFTAETPVAVILKNINDAPVPPSKLNPYIPKGLEQIILCAMEKRPQDRYQSATQMLRRIRDIKLNPNTVFPVTKPKKTPTSETVIKKTSKPSRDTTDFDFIFSDADDIPQRHSGEYVASAHGRTPTRGTQLPSRSPTGEYRRTSIPVSRMDTGSHRTPPAQSQRSGQAPLRQPVQKAIPPQKQNGAHTARRTQQASSSRQQSIAKNSSLLIFLIIFLTVAIVATILLTTFLSKSEVPMDIFASVYESADRAETALLYLKQVHI